jgi:hypothetical protein
MLLLHALNRSDQQNTTMKVGCNPRTKEVAVGVAPATASTSGGAARRAKLQAASRNKRMFRKSRK